MNQLPRKTLEIVIGLDELQERAGIKEPWHVRLYLKNLLRHDDIHSLEVIKGMAIINVYADTELSFMLKELGDTQNGKI